MTVSKILLIVLIMLVQMNVSAKNMNKEHVEITDKQAKALKSLNKQESALLAEQQNHLQNTQVKKTPSKTIRLNVTELTDNQGQVYLGAIVSRAELSLYLVKLEELLGEDFVQYRAFQSARDHQLFHMTLISPPEYQLVDKALVEKLLAPEFNSNFSSQLNVSLLGLGKVIHGDKEAFFVVAQSNDAQLIRQRFLLKNKDFHVTLGFKPSDIYGVKKDSSTLID